MPSHRTRYRLIEPIDQRQRELTARWILPHLDGIMEDLADLRVALNRSIAAEARRRSCEISEALAKADEERGGGFMGETLTRIVVGYWPKFQPHLRSYPKGVCTGVTHAIFDFLTDDRGDFAHTSLRWLLAFRDAGGVFKTVWGSIRGIYFQNAMQVGSHYIDVANDTVDVTKPSTEQAPMESSGFRNFETFGEYARVRSSYLGDQLYRNNFIPELLPYRPLITVNHAKRAIRIDDMSEPISRIIELGNVAGFADIAAPVVDRLEAESLIAKLGAPFGQGPFAGKVSFRAVENTEWQAILTTFEQRSMAERFRDLPRVTRIARFINLIWARSNLYDRLAGDLPR